MRLPVPKEGAEDTRSPEKWYWEGFDEDLTIEGAIRAKPPYRIEG